MRSLLIAPVVALVLASLAGCSSDPSSSSSGAPSSGAPTTSSGGTAAPKVTREMVRPAIEGTWTGTLVKDGVSTPATLVVKVRDTLATHCGGGTLSDDGALQILCIPTASLAIEAELSVGDGRKPLLGELEVPQTKFTGWGIVSLSSPQATVSGTLDPRAEAGAHQGSIRASVSFDGDRYEATFTNAR